MVFQLILSPNFTTSRLNRIGRQLQQVELAAGELAVNWQTTSARFASHGVIEMENIDDVEGVIGVFLYFLQVPRSTRKFIFPPILDYLINTPGCS